MYVCVSYIHVCVYTCMCVYMYVCIHVCVYTCMSAYMYECIHVCVYELHTCMCVYMYVCICNKYCITSKRVLHETD